MSLFIPNLSVDCVILGFDAKEQQLKSLVYQEEIFDKAKNKNWKFPGSLVPQGEDLDDSAQRILKELTGLSQVCLKQFHAFGNPKRIKTKEEKQWVEKHYGMKTNRVVTIAYYALIRIDENNPDQKNIKGKIKWMDIHESDNLAFDHHEILKQALSVLRKDVLLQDVNMFELLPQKFTITQLQSLYEVIMDQPLDKRNFRRKIAKAKYIKALNEKQKGVAHKPALLFSIDKEEYQNSEKYINTFFI